MFGRHHSPEARRAIGDANSGERNANYGKRGSSYHSWKGGKTADKDGRVLLFRLDHPFASRKGYVFRSRLVIEYFANHVPEFLERCLPYLVEIEGRYYLDPQKKAVIHHLDHDKANDDPDIGEVIEQYFGELKYDVCTMLEGEKVLETVSRIKPDLILLNLKLRQVHGMDVVENLKKVGFHGPVVIITGNVFAGGATLQQFSLMLANQTSERRMEESAYFASKRH